MRKQLLFCAIIFLIACTSIQFEPDAANVVVTNEPQATEIALAAETATSETISTPPSSLTETATSTSTATAPPTDTSVPTDTPVPPTAAATYTAMPTATATNTAIPTVIPMTNTPLPPPTPALPEAPLYPDTPIQTWDQGAFVTAVIMTNDLVEKFYPYFGRAVRDGGHCGIYWGQFGDWQSRPGFTDVPNDWRSLYFRYRTVLEDLRTIADPITQICTNGGGTISDETDQAILAGLENLLPQSRQLVVDVQAR